MKKLVFVSLCVNLCVINVCNAFFSPKELKIFDIFVNPYGISFRNGAVDLMKVTQNLGVQCATFNETLQSCSSIVHDITSFTNYTESLSKNCPKGSYSCFHKTVISSAHQSLKMWLAKPMKVALNKICKKQCWETLNKCITSGMSGITESEMTNFKFTTEVLKSLCSQDNNLSCVDKFINGVLKKKPETKNKNTCSSQCCEDLKEFVDDLGCCVGSVFHIMECYSIQPRSDSFGVLVKDSYSKCNIRRPPACTQEQKIQCPSIQNRSLSSPAASTVSADSSLTGKQIVGICLATVICLGMVIIVGNYFYHRVKKKAKVRFEDYGYSRLKMLEDEYYFDVEIDDDDDERTGLVSL